MASQSSTKPRKWIIPTALATFGAIYAGDNKDVPVVWVGIIGGIILGMVINFIIAVIESLTQNRI